MNAFFLKMRTFNLREVLGKRNDDLEESEVNELVKTLIIKIKLLPKSQTYGVDIPYNSPFDVKNRTLSQPLGKNDYEINSDIIANNVEFMDDNREEVPSYDRDWLLNQCQRLQTSLDSIKICTDIFTMLRSKKDLTDIQSSLVDLLGYDNMEFVTQLLSNRALIVKNIIENSQFISKPNIDKRDNTPQHHPQYGATVTVMTESDKQHQKQARKLARKQAKIKQDEYEAIDSATILGFDGERLKRLREEELESNAKAVLFSKPELHADENIKYPHIFQAGSGGSILSVFGTKFSLPEGNSMPMIIQEPRDKIQKTGKKSLSR